MHNIVIKIQNQSYTHRTPEFSKHLDLRHVIGRDGYLDQ